MLPAITIYRIICLFLVGCFCQTFYYLLNVGIIRLQFQKLLGIFVCSLTVLVLNIVAHEESISIKKARLVGIIDGLMLINKFCQTLEIGLRKTL